MKKSNCDNCVYRGTITGTTHYCRYYLVTGERRPCPPGDGCTVKVGREVKRRKKKEETDHGKNDP